MQMNRYDHIDIARGIAIILVVMGHSCSSNTGDLNRLILSFHMPLFFFLSGVFAKKIESKMLWEVAKKKAKKLLIPQILLGITIIVLNGLPWLLKGNSFLNFDLLSCFMYWFLPILFICTIAFMLVNAYFNLNLLRNKIVVLAIASILILFVHLSNKIPAGNVFILYAKLAPVAFIFYYAGYLFKRKILYVSTYTGIIKETLFIFAFLFLYLVSQWNSPVKMYMSEYGNFFLFLLSSFLGIFVVGEFSKRIRNVRIISEIGKISIAIYVWNFLIVGFTKSALFRALKYLGLYTSGAHAALTFLVSIVVIYFISKITLNYMPFLYGLKQNQYK